MREWLMRPEYMLWSLVFVPVLVLIVAMGLVGVRYHRLSRSPMQALRWWIPMGIVSVVYWGWLTEMEPVVIVRDAIIATVAISFWTYVVTRAAAFDPRRLFGGGAAGTSGRLAEADADPANGTGEDDRAPGASDG